MGATKMNTLTFSQAQSIYENRTPEDWQDECPEDSKMFAGRIVKTADGTGIYTGNHDATGYQVAISYLGKSYYSSIEILENGEWKEI